MNTNQKKILIAIIIVITGMLLYPPFHLTGGNGITVNMGYNWILSPPQRGYVTAKFDTLMLLIQWVGVFLVGGISYFLFGNNSSKPK